MYIFVENYCTFEQVIDDDDSVIFIFDVFFYCYLFILTNWFTDSQLNKLILIRFKMEKQRHQSFHTLSIFDYKN